MFHLSPYVVLFFLALLNLLILNPTLLKSMGIFSLTSLGLMVILLKLSFWFLWLNRPL